jgi:hypothetical protein
VQICTLPVGSGSLGIDSWGAPEIQKKRPQRLGGSALRPLWYVWRLLQTCALTPAVATCSRPKKTPASGVARWGQ